jgi:hypothetical protein
MEKMAFNITSNEFTVKIATNFGEACQTSWVFDCVTDMDSKSCLKSENKPKKPPEFIYMLQS